MPAPANVKKPADHKPKKVETGGDRKVKIRGIELAIAADALDDFELLDDLGALEEGNGARLPSVLRRLVGDQYRPLLDAVRDEESGRVSIEAGGELVQEILAALDPNS